MKIFMRNLGEGVTRRELATLIEDAARPPWYRFFEPVTRMQQCEVLQMTDVASGTHEYHGFVELSGKKAHKVLRHLNRMQIRGRPLEVRRWVERKGPEDRRARDIGANLDRRNSKPDRRRQLKLNFSSGVRHVVTTGP